MSTTSHVEIPSRDAMAEHCVACDRACMRAYAAAVHAGGLRAEEPHLHSLLDCAEICRLTAEFLLRRSALATQLLTVCTIAAGRCAEDCEQAPVSAERAACAATCWELAAAGATVR